jgi:hypothetical protein
MREKTLVPTVSAANARIGGQPGTHRLATAPVSAGCSQRS